MKVNIIQFKSIFADINVNEFWVEIKSPQQMEDQSQLVYKGKMYQSLEKSKKMIAFHFEIYPDKLIRILVNQNDENQDDIHEEEKFSKMDYLILSSCFIKKIKIQDYSNNQYTYGIRLQKENFKCELFAENSYMFNKWYDEIKRFCILSKFDKKYKIIQKLNTSNSYKCFRFSDSNQYQVKIFDKGTISSSQEKQILKETRVLRKLNSQYVTKLHEVYENENNLFIVSELVQGLDMKYKLSNAIVLDEKIISEIIWKLLNALQHIHQKNIFHRDIKLENIQFKNLKTLVDVQLINFQSADFFYSNQIKNYKKYGTAGFIAPEVFNHSQYNQKIDVFSLGIIFYILLYGKLPFDSNTLENIIKLNEKCEIDFDTKSHIIKCSSSAKDLLIRMLEKNPLLRPNASELINHTWFVCMKNKQSAIYNSMSTIVEKSFEQSFNKQSQDNYSEIGTTFIEENTIGTETLNQKMNVLNSDIYQKVPSKFIRNLNQGINKF
ncbi:protein kinase domain protein [Ichthyophthirius multifiliis]|uniref:Protein kinase domain protein n=1 Tax=Ichthyophthirius multifiliis TaxID=5932 RepID=G0QTQ3_ICHMU|nr:protein kinase domain protein [Ichthyophthirius multifiliis]EGR31402.1 protein kinase domain protein [Ichthyophthirius multifiliis]|eukprot:XP_004034888.1 protein kinase domain protein [Ichthyophthirius multifiliis]